MMQRIRVLFVYIEEFFIRATANKIKEKVAEQVANMFDDKQ